jgi:peptide/nickel transport system substrate-binding protein
MGYGRFRLPGSLCLVAVLACMTIRLQAHAIVAALLVLATGCTRSGGTEAAGARHSWTQAGTVRVAIREPKTLNPLLVSSTIDGFIVRLMFEPLLSADPSGNPVPMLASEVPTTENGGISKDGLTVTYHVRADAKWSDGVPVTSEDVRWSWSAIMSSVNNVVSRHGYDDIRAIDTPDARTAVVHLKERFAPFVNTFFAESDQPYMVAPAHILSRFHDINQIPFNGEPTVSDGPFRFASWHRSDSIDVIANPNFFQGKPGLDRVHITFVPNDNTAVGLLQAHEIDYIFQAPIEMYPDLAKLPDAKMVFVDMNGFEGMEFNLTHPFVHDASVRRAILSAIDKNALVQTLTHGQNKIATEDIPDWMWAYDKTVPIVKYDPAESKRLLAAAGWQPGSDGVLRKDGQPFELLLAADVGATHRSESILLQAALRRVGIDVEVKYYPESLLYAPAGAGGIMHSGKFDMLLTPWYSGIDPDNSSQFTCANVPPHGYNDTHYCEREMDAAQQIALTHYSRAERKPAYATIESLLARDNPEVFFWWQRQLEPISVDFKGFTPNPVTESWNAWQWSI